MLFTILTVLFGLLVLLLILLAILWWRYSPEKICHHIRQNPDNGALYLVRNNKTLLQKNPDQPLPLASTVKIIIAICFAKQAAANQINPNETVPLAELDVFFIKGTDGGAHKDWLNDIDRKGLVQNGAVRLKDIARGMILFSSNANTEFLMTKLGLEQINQILHDLKLRSHEPLYPFVSALLVVRDHSLEELKKMGKDSYIKASLHTHEQLKAGQISKRIKRKDVSLAKQKIFSEWFTRSSAQDYATILDTLNAHSFFSPATYDSLDEIMAYERPMPLLKFGGEKGGQTLFIFTIALYETTQNGDKTELVLLLNNLSFMQSLIFSLTVVKLKADLVIGRNVEYYQGLLTE